MSARQWLLLGVWIAKLFGRAAESLGEVPSSLLEEVLRETVSWKPPTKRLFRLVQVVAVPQGLARRSQTS